MLGFFDQNTLLLMIALPLLLLVVSHIFNGVAVCSTMTNLVASVGVYTLSALQGIGKITFFAASGIKSCFAPPFYFRSTINQIIVIGFYSLPIVGLTALFAGMVLAMQMHVGFTRFNAEGSIASVVVISMTRELGPVFAGLMVAGRMSSSIAAELGSMRVSEQIDALVTLHVDPLKFLVAPRIVAGVLTLPLLVFVADVIGVLGGMIVSTTLLNFSVGSYVVQTISNLELMDVLSGLAKAAAFGFSIACFGCYHGFNSELGARGVGESATTAVVSSCICILGLNYLLTAVFFGI
ncbi:MAG: ABC transporter permease [Holosporaceae bacterium]|jgi:phospholipid/cholesterol/gamma-HCH transport system permease protein|nr:ABC transporter permease [Holosporaceae bacterium]